MTRPLLCPSCGAPLDEPPPGESSLRCGYCKTVIRLDESRADPAAQTAYSDLLSEARELTLQGNKIRAIKLLRDTLAIGLAEAKTAADHLELGEDAALADYPLRAAAEIGRGNTQDVLAAIQAGNKIEAIRIFRARFGVGLKEAKDAVDAIEVGLSELPDEAGDTFTPSMETIAAGYSLARGVQTASKGLTCLSAGITILVILGLLAGVMVPILLPGGPLANWFSPKNDPGPEVELSFGEEGSRAGFFKDPRALAITRTGEYFVADYSTGRVQHFSEQGEFLNLWIVEPDAIIQALAVDSAGSVYVVSQGEVRVYDAAGQLLKPFPTPEGLYIEDLVIAADGSFVAVANGDSLLRFSVQRELLWLAEDAVSSAAGESELNTKIAVDGLGYIYAAGSFTESVFKFSPAGKFIDRWGGSGEEDGQFRAILSIGADADGRIYVSDIRGIQVFSSDGRFIELIEPGDPVFTIRFDRQNRLHVVMNTPRVVRYAAPRNGYNADTS